jgi:hypothetical protein
VAAPYTYIVREARNWPGEIWMFSRTCHAHSRSLCNSVAANALTMLSKLSPVLFLCFFLVRQVLAQSGTISVGPLMSCTLTTFTCPGVSGCCTIGGCCGGGCCANGYTCINEGTSTEACCPVSDTTKCGTAPSVSPLEQTCRPCHLVVSSLEINSDNHA